MTMESVTIMKAEPVTEESVTEPEQEPREIDMVKVMVEDAMEEETGNRVCKANKR